MKINVLGVEYDVREVTPDQMPDGADGYCDLSERICAVDGYAEEKAKTPAQRLKESILSDLDVQIKKNKRHEIVHAFLNESGLWENSWARNEEMVDWIAIQGPKIYAAWKAAGAL